MVKCLLSSKMRIVFLNNKQNWKLWYLNEKQALLSLIVGVSIVEVLDVKLV